MSALFVTSTGTDIGKTFVTAGLIRLLRDQGAPVDALKPIVSGYDPSVAETSDPAVLLRALGRAVEASEVAAISPWRYRAPLSPDQAAAQENRPIDFAALAKFSQEAIAAHKGHLFIEGVGGIMVPINERYTVLDWMTALRIPVLLVVGSYLGTISHTLTALQVLASRNLRIAAIVVSESDRNAVPLEQTVASIEHFSAGIAVIGLPRLPGGLNSHPAFAEIARQL
ncbi:MAG: dethiobiotin synthase [Pseudolabrys sp.]|nr:dethiobiotin synthase [Pseudolabrys sp.]MBV9954010.1 dethiobiotin synthase [Pseudolabrys sp.]